MRKLLMISGFGFLFVLLAVGLVLVGPASPASEKLYVLKWADVVPEVTEAARTIKYWAAEVEKRTKGRVKVEFYWSQSLVKGFDIMGAIGSGLAQAGTYLAGYDPARAPFFTVATLPGCPTENTYAAHMAATRIAEHPAVIKELTGNNVKFLFSMGSSGEYMCFRKPVKNLEDIKGLKIRAWGDFAKAIKIWGGVPVTMPGPETYEAMARGVIDGNHLPMGGLLGERMCEVAPHLLLFKIGINAGSPGVINLDFWNKLPPDIREVIEQVNKEVPRKLTEICDQVAIEGMKTFKACGMHIYEISLEEKDKARKMCEPIWEEWTVEKEKRGLPAREILNLYFSEVRKFEKVTK